MSIKEIENNEKNTKSFKKSPKNWFELPQYTVFSSWLRTTVLTPTNEQEVVY